MNFGGGHPAPGHGKISARCVPEGASDGKNTGSWQHIACMYSNTANLGKICVACIRKAPQSAVGEYTARTSCRQGALSPSEALKPCTAHESCHPPAALPLRRGSCPSNRIAGSPFNGLALAQGCLPQRPANTRRLPCPLQPETSRRWASAAIIRLMACSPAKPRGDADRIISTGRPTTECCAELGLDSRTVNKWAQNRRRRPQARPVLRQRCQKRPSKGRVPLGGTIGTPKNSYQSCFLGLPLAEFAPVAVSPTVPQLRQEFSQHKRHAGFLGLPFDQFAPVVLTVVPVGFTAPMPRRAFLGCISPVRARAVRDLLVLLRLLRLPVLRLATRIEMMTQSIA